MLRKLCITACLLMAGMSNSVDAWNAASGNNVYEQVCTLPRRWQDQVTYASGKVTLTRQAISIGDTWDINDYDTSAEINSAALAKCAELCDSYSNGQCQAFATDNDRASRTSLGDTVLTCDLWLRSATLPYWVSDDVTGENHAIYQNDNCLDPTDDDETQYGAAGSNFQYAMWYLKANTKCVEGVSASYWPLKFPTGAHQNTFHDATCLRPDLQAGATCAPSWYRKQLRYHQCLDRAIEKYSGDKSGNKFEHWSGTGLATEHIAIADGQTLTRACAEFFAGWCLEEVQKGCCNDQNQYRQDDGRLPQLNADYNAACGDIVNQTHFMPDADKNPYYYCTDDGYMSAASHARPWAVAVMLFGSVVVTALLPV